MTDPCPFVENSATTDAENNNPNAKSFAQCYSNGLLLDLS